MGMVTVKFKEGIENYLTLDGSRVWVYNNSGYKAWDFGILGFSPVQSPSMPTLHLSDPMVWDISQSRIKDTVTGKVVFQLSGRFAKPIDVQCDGSYLAAFYQSGEVLILHFNDVFFQ